MQTNQPQLEFVGTGSIEITSAFIELAAFGDFTSLQIWGDLRNTSTQIECIPLIDLQVGTQEVISVAYGPAYFVPAGGATLSSVCLLPQATGMFSSIQNEVPPTLVTTANQVTYQVTSIPSPDAFPHMATPMVLTSAVEPAEFAGWQVSGQVMASTSITNLFIEVFTRNAQGFAFDRLSAFPTTIPVGTALDFTTTSTEGTITEFELFLSFFTPAAAALSLQTLQLSPFRENSLAERQHLHESRALQADEFRGQLGLIVR